MIFYAVLTADWHLRIQRTSRKPRSWMYLKYERASEVSDDLRYCLVPASPLTDLRD